MKPTTRPLTREPAVAGLFYPGDADAVRAEARQHLAAPPRAGAGASSAAQAVIAAIVPHAGWRYSGDVAGRTLSAIDIPRRVIILCPNHTGRGARVAVAAHGAFRVPGADVPVDEPLASALIDAFPGAREDWSAHADEHAIEVQLPLLVARRPDVAIVPVVVGGLGEADALALGAALARVVQAAGEPVLLIASSDMNHYLDDDETRRRDRRALEPALALDPVGLYRRVRAEDITMCGVLPATAVLEAARRLGASRARLVDYGTSADASGDTRRVVGYAGVTIA
jgi:hypothetical protein